MDLGGSEGKEVSLWVLWGKEGKKNKKHSNYLSLVEQRDGGLGSSFYPREGTGPRGYRREEKDWKKKDSGHRLSTQPLGFCFFVLIFSCCLLV